MGETQIEMDGENMMKKVGKKTDKWRDERKCREKSQTTYANVERLSSLPLNNLHLSPG